jgi:hypothetical protein
MTADELAALREAVDAAREYISPNTPRDDDGKQFDRLVAALAKTDTRPARVELAAKNKAIESAIKALRAVVHDRPTAHTDEVWNQLLAALSELEALP